MRKTAQKIIAIVALLAHYLSNMAFALNASDCINHTSGVNPVTNGNTTTITTTNNIDTFQWNKFNVGSNETAFFQFTQNGQTAVNYLNPGSDASAIFGTIRGSNDFVGNVLLFNPNGITIGTGANITDLNSFFASTNQFKGVSGNNVLFEEAATANALNIGDVNFNNVNNAFFVAPGVVFKANNAQTKDNFAIKITGGGSFDTANNDFSNEIAVKNPLLADVQGNIKSKNIELTAKVDTDSAVDFHVAAKLEANSVVENEDGSIYLLATNENTSENSSANFIIDGKFSGNSAKVDIKADKIALNAEINTSGTNKNGGEISIEGKKEFVSNGAKIISDSDTKDGGLIKVTGDYTKIYGTEISASGGDKGGTIYLGGATKTEDILASSLVTGIDPESIIKANGGTEGGKIYLNSKGTTYAYGTYETLGKGFVEVSSQGNLAYITEKINTGGGTFLIDPKDIIIRPSGSTSTDKNDYTFAVSPADTYYLTPATIQSWIPSSAFIQLQANNDIVFQTSVNLTGLSNLSLQAGRSIIFNPGVSVAGMGYATVYANMGTSSGVVDAYRDSGAAVIEMGSGSLLSSSGNIVLGLGTGEGLTYNQTGNVTLENVNANILNLTNGGLSDGSSIILNGTLNVEYLTGSTYYGDMTQGVNSVLNVNRNTTLRIGDMADGYGNVSLTGNDNNFGGSFDIWNADNVDIYSKGSYLTIGTAYVDENLTLTTAPGCHIWEIGSTMSIGGKTTLTAGTSANPGNVTISGTNNNLQGPIEITSANDVSIRNNIATILDNVDAKGQLTLLTSGDVTQNAGTTISLGGNLNANTQDNDIILDNSGNNIIGSIALDAKNATVKNSTDIMLNTVTTTGDLVLTTGTAGSKIDKLFSSALNVAGTTTLTAGTADAPGRIALLGTNNNLQGPIAITNADNTFLINNVATILDNVNIQGSLVLQVTNGNLTQTPNSRSVVGGSTSLDVSGGNIVLTNTDNDFIGYVSASAPSGSITIHDSNTLKCSDISSGDGDITLVANTNNTTGTPGDLIVDVSSTLSTAGNINLEIANTPNSGDIIINNSTPISAPGNITIWNKSTAPGADVILNGAIQSTGSGPNPLLIIAEGGNVLNPNDTAQLTVNPGERWLIYTGSPWETELGSLVGDETYYYSTITNRPPSTVIPYVDSVLYRTGPIDPPDPPTPGGGGSNAGTGGIVAGGVVGGSAAGGAGIAAIAPIFLAGLNPGTTIAAKPLYLAANSEQAEGTVTGTAAPLGETTGNSNFYYDKEKNRIIWVNTDASSTITQ